MLLERSDSPYAQLLATTTLTKLISRTNQVLSLQQRIDIREFLDPPGLVMPPRLTLGWTPSIFSGNYVLTYLYSQPKMAQFVVQGLVALFSRITKLGWFDSQEDNFVFRDVIQDVTKFLQASFRP